MFRSQISNLIPLFLTGLLSAQVHGEAKKAKDARVVLDAWHQESPRAEERTLHFVLWTPNNRELPHQHEARLGRIMEHLQNFYGKEMDRLGFGPRSINLPRDPDGQVKIHLIKGDHPTAHYQKSSGSDIRKECLPVLRKAGINAHTPASHTYDLGKKFTSLTGSSGIAAGKRGSVQFEIKGDGKTLWRSKTLQAGNLAPYKVDLKGVNKIELLTHPTNDGSASDWALWLAPTLESK